jgi:hypothetical protein
MAKTPGAPAAPGSSTFRARLLICVPARTAPPRRQVHSAGKPGRACRVRVTVMLQSFNASHWRRAGRLAASASIAVLFAFAPVHEASAGWAGRGGAFAGGGRHPGGAGYPGFGGHRGGYHGDGHYGGGLVGPRPGCCYGPRPIHVDEPVYADDVFYPRPRRIRISRPPAPQRDVEFARPVRKRVVMKPAVLAKPAQPPRQLVKKVVERPDPPPKRLDAASAGFAPGEVLCEIKDDVSTAVVDQIGRRYGLQRRDVQRIGLVQSSVYRFAITNGAPVSGVVQKLEADKRVASVQPNYIFKLQDAAGLAGAQYASSKLRLEQVHHVATGEGIVVAVIDSGVDAAHPELAGAVSANVNALASDARVDAHGTAIAGVIAAHANLVGVAPSAKILAIRAFSGDAARTGATGATSDIVRALSIAADTGAKIVNMSFAGPSDPLLKRVIAAAHERGMTMVAAAGNAGPSAPPAFPAADPHVIAVTATDSADALFPSANRGAYVGIAAPGVDVLVASPGVGYSLSSGTSIAAAHVSGVLALMLQRDPKLTPADARRMLVESAKDLGPSGRDDQFGAGLVDAERALGEALRDGQGPAASNGEDAQASGTLATAGSLE